jgi:hypothetical protein
MALGSLLCGGEADSSSITAPLISHSDTSSTTSLIRPESKRVKAAETLVRSREALRRLTGCKKVLEPGSEDSSRNTGACEAPNNSSSTHTELSVRAAKERLLQEEARRFRKVKASYTCAKKEDEALRSRLMKSKERIEDLEEQVDLLEEALTDTTRAFQLYASKYGPGVNLKIQATGAGTEKSEFRTYKGSSIWMEIAAADK